MILKTKKDLEFEIHKLREEYKLWVLRDSVEEIKYPRLEEMMKR